MVTVGGSNPNAVSGPAERPKGANQEVLRCPVRDLSQVASLGATVALGFDPGHLVADKQVAQSVALLHGGGREQVGWTLQALAICDSRQLIIIIIMNIYAHTSP